MKEISVFVDESGDFLKLMEEYDPLEEFGINADDYKEIIDYLNLYFDTHEFAEGEFEYDMYSDEDDFNEEQEYLNILNSPDFEVIYEQHGWERAGEIIGKFDIPDDGNEYMLLFTIAKDKEVQSAFATTALAVLLGKNLRARMNSLEELGEASQKFGCNVTESDDGKNHFWLLISRKPTSSD